MSMFGVGPEVKSTLRYKRLKKVFEGRSRQLEHVRNTMFYPYSAEDNRRYSEAVTKYTEARRKWRAIRGWK